MAERTQQRSWDLFDVAVNIPDFTVCFIFSINLAKYSPGLLHTEVCEDERQ